MNKTHLISILSLCFFLSLTSTTFAHNKSESYSNWNLNKDKITGIITIPSHEVTRLPEVKISNVSLAEIFLEHAKANIDIYNKIKTAHFNQITFLIQLKDLLELSCNIIV